MTHANGTTMAHGNISTTSTNIPSSSTSVIWVQNQPFGCLMCVLSLFLITLYVPCAIVLWQPAQIKNSCYKIMACMAIVDISNLIIGGFIGGVVSVVGTSESFLVSNIDNVSIKICLSCNKIFSSIWEKRAKCSWIFYFLIGLRLLGILQLLGVFLFAYFLNISEHLLGIISYTLHIHNHTSHT